MTTFRGSEGSPQLEVDLTDIKIKKNKSVKPKRGRSKSAKDLTQKAAQTLQPKQQKSQTIVGSFDQQEKQKSLLKIKQKKYLRDRGSRSDKNLKKVDNSSPGQKDLQTYNENQWQFTNQTDMFKK